MSGKTAGHSGPKSSEESDEGSQQLYAAPALEKGLDILELLSRQEAGLTRRDIAERLGRSVSEVFRLSASLVAPTSFKPAIPTRSACACSNWRMSSRR